MELEMSYSQDFKSVASIQENAQSKAIEAQMKASQTEEEAAVLAWEKKCAEITISGYKGLSKIADTIASGV
jgi:hypothetical protein